MRWILLLLLALPFPRPALSQYVEESRNFPLRLQRAARRATVRIPSHGGSGVFIGQDNTNRAYLLTAGHVFSRGNVTLDLFDGNGRTSTTQQELLFRDDDTDIAILRVTLNIRVEVLPVVPPELSPTGRNVPTLSVGCDGMRDAYCWTCYSDFDSDRKWILTRRAPHGGRSGGPLIDRYGFVVGICSRTTRNGRGQDIPPGLYVRPRAIRSGCGASGNDWVFQQHPSVIITAKAFPPPIPPQYRPRSPIPTAPYFLPYGGGY